MSFCCRFCEHLRVYYNFNMTQIIGLSAFLPTMVAKLLVKKKKIIDIHTPMLATAQLCNQLHHNTEIRNAFPALYLSDLPSKFGKALSTTCMVSLHVFVHFHRINEYCYYVSYNCLYWCMCALHRFPNG